MQAIEVLEDSGNGKVLVHCSHGKDRTGLVIAVYRCAIRIFARTPPTSR
ncbi:MAG: tyrosine-protein phosphatase [Burkholderiales bacterium]